MQKINFIEWNNWNSVEVNWSVENWELVTIIDWIAVNTTNKDDLILWVSKWSLWNWKSIINLIYSNNNYLINFYNIEVDNNFLQNVKDWKMESIYFTWTWFSYNPTWNKLCWYSTWITSEWIKVMFFDSILLKSFWTSWSEWWELPTAVLLWDFSWYEWQELDFTFTITDDWSPTVNIYSASWTIISLTWLPGIVTWNDTSSVSITWLINWTYNWKLIQWSNIFWPIWTDTLYLQVIDIWLQEVITSMPIAFDTLPTPTITPTTTNYSLGAFANQTMYIDFASFVWIDWTMWEISFVSDTPWSSLIIMSTTAWVIDWNTVKQIWTWWVSQNWTITINYSTSNGSNLLETISINWISWKTTTPQVSASSSITIDITI